MMFDSPPKLNSPRAGWWRARFLSGLMLLGLASVAAPAAAAPPPPENLALAIDTTTGIFAEADVTAFAVVESAQGKDLNGDGDSSDRVLHLYRSATGRVENTRQVVISGVHNSFCRSGDHLAFVASEDGRIDFNQDGDTQDGAMHVLNLATGFLQHAPQASSGGLACGGGHVAYTVSESMEQRDYNGDGDRVDQVWHVYDIAAADSHNLELARMVALNGSARMSGDALLFTAHEPSNARDLNQDGDQIDRVFFHYGLASRITTNYGLAGSPIVDERDYGTRAAGRFVPVLVPEGDQGSGRDLNGDGDTDDTVAHAVDMANGNLIVGAAGGAMPSTSNWLTLFVSEQDEGGADLNGDGDTADQVLVFQRATTGARWNTQRALRGIPSYAPNASSFSGSGFDGRRVAAEVWESDSQLDLDGDGLMNRSIVEIFDPRFQSIVNTRFNSRCLYDPEEVLTVGRAHLLGCTFEAHQGRDINGDGDLLDVIAGSVGLGGGGARSSDIAMDRSDPMRVRGSTGYFLALESDQGADLNGDGDRFDRVLQVFDLGSGATQNTGLSIVTTFGAHDRVVWDGSDDALFFGADERADRQDYNGDGDTFDIVLHRLP